MSALNYQWRWGLHTLKSFRLFYDHEIAVSELKILLTSEINLYNILWTEMMQSNSMEVHAAGVHAQGWSWRQTRQL